MGPEASINNATDNAKSNAYNIGNPVVHIGGAVKARLDELNHRQRRSPPKNTGSNPKRPVLERGKESAAKVTRCTNLSLPFGAGGGWSKSHSIATESIAVTISVEGCLDTSIRQG